MNRNILLSRRDCCNQRRNPPAGNFLVLPVRPIRDNNHKLEYIGANRLVRAGFPMWPCNARFGCRTEEGPLGHLNIKYLFKYFKLN